MLTFPVSSTKNSFDIEPSVKPNCPANVLIRFVISGGTPVSSLCVFVAISASIF
jgi:hypothetical protein